MPVSFLRCPPVVIKVFRESRFLAVSQPLVPAHLLCMIPTFKPDIGVYLRYMRLLKHFYYRTTGPYQARQPFSAFTVFLIGLVKGMDVSLTLRPALLTFVVVYHVKPPHP